MNDGTVKVVDLFQGARPTPSQRRIAACLPAAEAAERMRIRRVLTGDPGYDSAAGARVHIPMRDGTDT